MNFLRNVREGQGQIADTLKLLVFKKHPDIFEKLDFTNDLIFTEPLLFTYFNYSGRVPVLPLEQVLWHYLDTAQKGRALFSNKKGNCYIPNVGLVETPYPNSMLAIETADKVFVVKRAPDQHGVSCKLRASDTIRDSRIELMTESNQLLDRFFRDENGEIVVVDEVDVALKEPAISAALSVLRSVNPEYAECVEAVTRCIFLYQGSPNSFATIQAHGIAFFNVKPSDGIVAFLDNIAHQCGHIVFNSVTFDKDAFFAVPATTRLSQFTGDVSDVQDIYARFHGLFTQTNINTTIARCVQKKLFADEELYELIGRFSSNMKRFGVALDKLSHPGMYSARGMGLYSYSCDVYRQLMDEWGTVISRLDVSNQPYVFDYKLFRDTNSAILATTSF